MEYLQKKDGFISVISKEEFEKNNRNYKAFDHEKNYWFLDKDSKNLIPLVKDILNRKFKFIEVKLLFLVIIMLFIGFIVQIITIFYLDNSKYLIKEFGQINTSIWNNTKVINEMPFIDNNKVIDNGQ